MSDHKDKYRKAKQDYEKIISSVENIQKLFVEKTMGTATLEIKDVKSLSNKKKKPQLKRQKIKSRDLANIAAQEYNKRLEILLSIQNNLQAMFEQHPVVLEFNRRELVEKQYKKLSSEYRLAQQQVNQFYNEAKSSYLTWINLIDDKIDE